MMHYLSQTHRPATEKYIQFVNEGLKQSKILPYNEVLQKDHAEGVWLFGILRGTDLVYKHCQKNKINFYFMDRPYWGISRQSPYFLRIVKNGHVKNTLEDRPDDRFKATFPYEISPYHKNGKKVLVCPPTNAICDFFGCRDWLDKTLKELKDNTDREIIIREKPYNPEVYKDDKGVLRTGGNSSQQSKEKIDWREIHAVVTYNSSITIKALANGVPVFTDVNNCAYPISSTNFSKIESPTYIDPRPLFYSLAYGQFTANEMRKGYVSEILDGR